jgi:antibiotic biosynthesis monooxygenase (ABM) superfamily enzyme
MEEIYEKENQIVTVVVSRRIKKTKEILFEKLSDDLTLCATKFEGYIGAVMLRPSSMDDPEYRVIYKFKSQTYLDEWINSDIRTKLLDEIEPLLEESSQITQTSGILTWLTLPGATKVMHPKKYKITMVSWLALYPLITIIFFLFGDILKDIPLIFRTLLVTAVAMIVMSYVLMPRFTKWFSFWLFPKDKEKLR